MIALSFATPACILHKVSLHGLRASPMPCKATPYRAILCVIALVASITLANSAFFRCFLNTSGFRGADSKQLPRQKLTGQPAAAHTNLETELAHNPSLFTSDSYGRWRLTKEILQYLPISLRNVASDQVDTLTVLSNYLDLLHPRYNGMINLLHQWWSPVGANKFCGRFQKVDAQVALVGNGPVSRSQRARIQFADYIIRFNYQNSRDSKERTDVWIIRDGHFPRTYQSCEMASAAKHIVLLYNLSGPPPRSDVEAVVINDAPYRNKTSSTLHSPEWTLPPEWTKKMVKVGNLLCLSTHEKRIKLLPLQFGGTYLLWKNTTDILGVSKPRQSPSSGLTGVLLTLGCLPQSAFLDVYGFNWSSKNWFGHDMDLEQSIIQLLAVASGGRLRLHTTPCNGYRSCSEAT